MRKAKTDRKCRPPSHTFLRPALYDVPKCLDMSKLYAVLFANPRLWDRDNLPGAGFPPVQGITRALVPAPDLRRNRNGIFNRCLFDQRVLNDTGIDFRHCHPPFEVAQMITLEELENIFAKRTPPPEGVYLLDAETSYIPSSNTGCTSLVDYLTVTTSLLEFPHFNRSEIGLANKMFRRLFPEASIHARDFDDHGFLGYRYSADLYGPACDQPCGKIAYGGNNGTLLVSITGVGTPFIGSHEKLAKNLQDLDSRITRIDLAYDDLHGENIDFAFMVYLAKTGFFNTDNGKKAFVKCVDDLGNLSGSTLYVGRKGDKELCIYEKGKQLQASQSNWVRCEVRLWSKNRKIPLSVLTNGGAFMRGAFPQLSSFLPLAGSVRCVTTRAASVCTVEAEDSYIKNTIGRTLRLRQSCMQPAQFDAYVSELLCNTGMPRRWKSQPEIVVQTLIKEHADRELLA